MNQERNDREEVGVSVTIRSCHGNAELSRTDYNFATAEEAMQCVKETVKKYERNGKIKVVLK